MAIAYVAQPVTDTWRPTVSTTFSRSILLPSTVQGGDIIAVYATCNRDLNWNHGSDTPATLNDAPAFDYTAKDGSHKVTTQSGSGSAFLPGFAYVLDESYPGENILLQDRPYLNAFCWLGVVPNDRDTAHDLNLVVTGQSPINTPGSGAGWFGLTALQFRDDAADFVSPATATVPIATRDYIRDNPWYDYVNDPANPTGFGTPKYATYLKMLQSSVSSPGVPDRPDYAQAAGSWSTAPTYATQPLTLEDEEIILGMVAHVGGWADGNNPFADYRAASGATFTPGTSWNDGTPVAFSAGYIGGFPNQQADIKFWPCYRVVSAKDRYHFAGTSGGSLAPRRYFYTSFCRFHRTPRASGPTNLEDDLANYHRCEAPGGNLKYHWSHFTLPPFAVETQVTNLGGDTQPRIAVDYRPHRMRRVYLLFARGSDVYSTHTDDEGRTWSTAELWVSAARHPCIASEMNSGLLVRAAWKSDGTVTADRQYANADDLFNFTFLKADESNLLLEDDTFWLLPVPGSEARWYLFGRPAGGSNVGLYLSTDDCLTWVLKFSLFTGGRHPVMAWDPASGEIVLAAIVGSSPYQVKAAKWKAGDAAPGAEFVVTDKSGAALSVVDDTIGLSFGWEGESRLVMAAGLAGDTAISESWSSDERPAALSMLKV